MNRMDQFYYAPGIAKRTNQTEDPKRGVERMIELLEHEDSPRKHNNTISNEQGPGHTCRIAVPKGAAVRGSMSHLLGAQMN